MKKQITHLLIWTIVFWVTAIALILYLIPPTREEPTEIEKEIGWRWSTMDFRFLAVVMSIIWYSFGAIGIFVVHKKKQKKNQELQKDQKNHPFEPER